MGEAKRLQEKEEAKQQIALQMAIEAGVIARCPVHDDFTFKGSKDIQEAYKLGNAKFNKSELKELFKTRREMTDLIKDVVEDNIFPDECYYCSNLPDDV